VCICRGEGGEEGGEGGEGGVGKNKMHLRVYGGCVDVRRYAVSAQIKEDIVYGATVVFRISR